MHEKHFYVMMLELRIAGSCDQGSASGISNRAFQIGKGMSRGKTGTAEAVIGLPAETDPSI